MRKRKNKEGRNLKGVKRRTERHAFRFFFWRILRSFLTRPGVVLSTPRNRITSDVWVVRRLGRRSHPGGPQTSAPTQFTTRTAAVSVSSRANCGHRQHVKIHNTEPTWPNGVNLDHLSPVVAGRQRWVHAPSAGDARPQTNMPAVAHNETHTARRLRRWHFRRVYNATLAQLTLPRMAA